MKDRKVSNEEKKQPYAKPAIICERDVDVFAATCDSAHSGQPGCRLATTCLYAFS